MKALLAALLVLFAPPSRADDARLFVWGNSLVNHLTDSDETTVPHWLARLMAAGGHGFALDGAWGFPGDFAANLPPQAQWRFDEVPRAWTSGAFRMAGFDTAIVTPPNFVQSGDPAADLGTGPTLDQLGRVLAWAEDQMDPALSPRFLVYEGWAKLDDIAGFPPSAPGLRAWNDWVQGGAHDWYLDLAARLSDRIGRPVGLIPVGSVLSRLLSEPPLDAVPPEALFSDGAPHGTATTYLLAAMITYASLTGETPPPIALSPAVHPLLAGRYDAVAARVAALTGAAPPERALLDPGLGAGLAGIADWSTEQPFLDLMRSSRPWVGHQGGQFAAWSFERLMAAGHLSPEGWPRSLPEGVGYLQTFVLTDQPAGARSLAGTYVLRWEGTARVDVAGLARDVRPLGRNALIFAYAPGPGLVSISVRGLDPSDPLRAMTLVREDRQALWENGAIFNPDWTGRLGALRALRFMDWMDTNGSTQVEWSDRPLLSDATWAWRGVPVEVIARLANELGADPWVNVPHMASDGYARALATDLRDRLDPRLRVYAEWSNEAWNFIFPQALWARDQAVARWGEAAGEDAWMQYAGLRAAEVAEVWAEVFRDAPGRLVRVVAAHTGWPGLEDALLDAPLAVAEGRPAPSESFDAYAVTGYWGFEAGSEAMAGPLREALAEGRAEALLEGALRDDLRELTGELWPRHAAAAARRGLRLVAYEGGPHLVGQGAVAEDEALTELFTAFGYSPAMAEMESELLAAWPEVGGTLYMTFADVAAPSRWGSWGALRNLDDANPRWAALMAASARGAPWETRAPGTFADGALVEGTEGPDELGGTPEEDDLLGHGGDDRLAAGPGDRVHGGEGRDVAVLPGAAADWAPRREGAVTWLDGPGGSVRLFAVEAVEFASGGTLELGQPG